MSGSHLIDLWMAMLVSVCWVMIVESAHSIVLDMQFPCGNENLQ